MFILDGRLANGRRFITSTGNRADLASTRTRNALQRPINVFHWQQLEPGETADMLEGWRLIERFSL